MCVAPYPIGRRLVAVTINDGNDWADHKKLLENGFSQFTSQQIVIEGQIIGRVAVLGGETAWVQIRAAEDFSYAMAQGEQARILLSPPGFVYAPVAENQDAGFAYICIGDKTVGKIRVCYTQTVEQAKAPEKSFWQKLFGR